MRYLSPKLAEFTESKFVLLAGARQVGKTTIAREWLKQFSGRELNWDVSEDREVILKKSFLNPAPPLALLLDEIHKYPRWKNYLKGLFDREASRLKVVVTGSARLDIHQRGGDSLLGRYELLRLHPFSIGEMTHGELVPPPADWLKHKTRDLNGEHWRQLKTFGGFPEPLFRRDPLFHQRWSTRRRELLINEDLRDIADVKLIELVEHLYLLLPERVGSLLSINSLREEIGVAFNTVSAWLVILERLFICYRLPPYTGKLARSLRKERKLYLWDWSQVPDPGPRFENMVVSHLLKSVHAWNDAGYGEFDLCYWRDKEKDEVDCVLTNKRKPVAIFECKLSDTGISRSLVKLQKSLGVPAIQFVETPGIDTTIDAIRVVSAPSYLAGLV